MSGSHIDGMQRMLDFLDRLEEKNLVYFLTRYSPDGLTVTFTVVGARIEVEFTPKGMTYSWFEGDEGVEDDEDTLDQFVNGTYKLRNAV